MTAIKDEATKGVVLVSNGPGELYTWVKPVLGELRRQHPSLHITISLIPCQFASGQESTIARSFAADKVTTPKEALQLLAGQRGPFPKRAAAVIGLGGSAPLAARLAQKLHAPLYRYAFVPYWHRRLQKLLVDSPRTAQRARLLGAPRNKVEIVGNLVADAVEDAEAVSAAGAPHLILMCGSRDGFARHVIPFMLALADTLHARYPKARFVWPVSRLLTQEVIAAGIAGEDKETLGGIAGVREGDVILTPQGARVEMVAEAARYAHMKAATLAVTIPGTNTLELGMAGVPAVVLLPLNKPEVIPLEGPGHWLSLIPLLGLPLKRRAVLLAAPHLPVSLPNNLSGENLMVELKGNLSVEDVRSEVVQLLEAPQRLAQLRSRLTETLPQPGAAAKLVAALEL